MILIIGLFSLPKISHATELADKVMVQKETTLPFIISGDKKELLTVHYPVDFEPNESEMKKKNEHLVDDLIVNEETQTMTFSLKENVTDEEFVMIGRFVNTGGYSFIVEENQRVLEEFNVFVDDSSEDVPNEEETKKTVSKRSIFQSAINSDAFNLTRMSSLPNDPDILPINKIFQPPIGTSTSILENGKLLQLNPPRKNQRGAIWSRDRVSLLSDFTFKSYLYLGDQYANAADGMTFTLTNDPRMSLLPTQVIGSSGVGIGAYSSGYGQAYIRNALSIEFDTYKNQGTSDRMDREITTDNRGYGHVAFVTPKINNQNYTGEHVGVTVAPTYLSNNTWRTLIVKWNAKEQMLTYDLEGVGSQSVIITNILGQFGSTSVYWGFTSSTGAYFEENSLAITEIPSNVTSKAEIRRADGVYSTEVDAEKNDKVFIRNLLKVDNDFIGEKHSQVNIEVPKELNFDDQSVTINGQKIGSNDFSMADNLLTVNIQPYLSSKKEMIIEFGAEVKDASVDKQVSTNFGYLEDSIMFLRSNKVSVNIKKPKEKTINIFYKELGTNADLAPVKRITGKFGEPYSETFVPINGYVFDHDSGNVSGVYSENSEDIFFYYKKGELVFVSAPEVLNFGDNLKIATTDKTYAIQSQTNQLVVQDFRGSNKKWRMTATLLKELTNQNDYVLTNSLYYKQNNQEDEFSIGNAINIMENETLDNKPVDISSYWSGLDKGPILKVKAGKAAAGNYSGTIQWALEDVPLNGG